MMPMHLYYIYKHLVELEWSIEKIMHLANGMEILFPSKRNKWMKEEVAFLKRYGNK